MARPEPNYKRKAAIVFAGARDYRGHVDVSPLPDFDLDSTIYRTLEGPVARWATKQVLGVRVCWHEDDARQVQRAYRRAIEGLSLPELSPELIDFLADECDFEAEHAEGSFLEHLYFCFEYTAKHHPRGSPLVMLLHSILGTATNSFAMHVSKLPKLEALLRPTDFEHVQAFPSILRLLYVGDLRRELRANLGRELRSISMHRVIDNRPIELSGEQFWEAMSYQLIHLVDFVPVANWRAHRNDSSYVLFRDLLDLMTRAGKRVAEVTCREPPGSAKLVDEWLGLGGWLATKVPVAAMERMSAARVRRFSEQCGHQLSYRVDWV